MSESNDARPAWPEQGPPAAARMASGVAKTRITNMLSEDPDARAFHDVFAAVPRSAGGQTESTPLAAVPVAKGLEFGGWMIFTTVKTLIVCYVFSVGIGIITSLANMIGGSCGQDVWRTSPEEACGALMTNAVALSIELRCLATKPAAMAQADYDDTCGSSAFVGTIISIVLLSAFACQSIWNDTSTMPGKVAFHPKLFVVESIGGKRFTCSFYADVTKATVSKTGLSITTKGAVSLAAGGLSDTDKEFKNGATLYMKGDSSIWLPIGASAGNEQLLQEFAKRLPVSIDGLGGARPQPAESSGDGASSILDGRLGELLRARKAESAGSFEPVRKPVSCDFVTEFFFIMCCVLGIWYVVSTVSTLIGWAITKGQGKCMDPLRPGEDMCAVWRIFVPISVPITNPSDYINLVILVLTLTGYPLWYLAHMTVEQRFHSNGFFQELLLAKKEWQANPFVFAGDVKALEMKKDSLEQYVQVTTQAHYIVENGISSPFTVNAKFFAKDIKVTLVDGDCASCSGHRPQAQAHREALLRLFNTFKPGLLRLPEGVEAPVDSSSQPTQERMPDQAGEAPV